MISTSLPTHVGCIDAHEAASFPFYHQSVMDQCRYVKSVYDKTEQGEEDKTGTAYGLTHLSAQR